MLAEPGVTRLKYWAFISYSQADKKWGGWLHRAKRGGWLHRAKLIVLQSAWSIGHLIMALYPTAYILFFRGREELH
jgi:hypothetical protein